MSPSGKFRKINRYIKVSLLKKDNYVIIVTTFARMGLYDKLENEIKELHSVLETYNGKSEEKKTSWFKWVSIINEAHAAGFDLSSIINGSNTNTGTLGSGFLMTKLEREIPIGPTLIKK